MIYYSVYCKWQNHWQHTSCCKIAYTTLFMVELLKLHVMSVFCERVMKVKVRNMRFLFPAIYQEGEGEYELWFFISSCIFIRQLYLNQMAIEHKVFGENQLLILKFNLYSTHFLKNVPAGGRTQLDELQLAFFAYSMWKCRGHVLSFRQWWQAVWWVFIRSR